MSNSDSGCQRLKIPNICVNEFEIPVQLPASRMPEIGLVKKKNPFRLSKNWGFLAPVLPKAGMALSFASAYTTAHIMLQLCSTGLSIHTLCIHTTKHQYSSGNQQQQRPAMDNPWEGRSSKPIRPGCAYTIQAPGRQPGSQVASPIPSTVLLGTPTPPTHRPSTSNPPNTTGGTSLVSGTPATTTAMMSSSSKLANT